ncbi:hypothetical protein SCP_0902280 [Sparassis crispa]|uniref:Flavin reductase like domain-containing protein n=1 Tax=Sparassis crispa TaxID=139825 RepID=A0A401GW03_9APHY|nr:hypothetical protein SCP_0902280 [Sparassis crispa]GBE86349.1 hypothetical protein SCP_0902280 [Sparassis crispa]
MPSGAQHNVLHSHSRFHGATLSSFSSIALDPYPLVAFSLRIPSRMAMSLKSAHVSLPVASHMVVNILSAAQVDTAVRFARPDLHPDPFAGSPYFLSAEGLPVLKDSVGALSCKLVAASWPLHDLELLEGRSNEETVWEGEGVASELFIARVTRVELLTDPEPKEDEKDLRTSPLLYYRRAYSTTRDIPGRSASETKS